MDYLPWIIAGVLAVLLIVLMVAYFRVSSRNRLLTNEVNDKRSANERLKRYYVDEEDRSAIANFIGANLDDVANPHRNDVIRILAGWGSTR